MFARAHVITDTFIIQEVELLRDLQPVWIEGAGRDKWEAFLPGNACCGGRGRTKSCQKPVKRLSKAANQQYSKLPSVLHRTYLLDNGTDFTETKRQSAVIMVPEGGQGAFEKKKLRKPIPV